MFRNLCCLSAITILFLSGTRLQAQCIAITPQPRVVNLACGVNCSNLTVRVPDIRLTDDYTLMSIPYAPYPFTNASGSEWTKLYDDDKYDSATSISFPFCFYGATYSKVVAGSNGLLTFDLANADPCSNAYTITPQIPSAGSGAICSQFATYYPRAAIMAAYSDLDPRGVASPGDKKIEWLVTGTAPCRRFIANYYHIGTFGNTCGINQTPATFQIVLHEATGIIDVFFQNVSCTSSTNNGRSIFGIQNWNRDKAVFEPSRNATVWNAQNEGWRFMPSAGSPLLQNVQFIRNGTVVGTGTVGASASGETTVTFNNYCAVTNNDTVVVRAIYKTCNDPDAFITGQDTIFVVKNPGDLLATATTSPAVCLSANGSITVTVPSGAGTSPYSYQLNGGPLQASNVFNGVPAGNHVVFVRDATGSCTSTINVSVGLSNPLLASATTTATSCPGASNGSITVTPSNGTGPYQYSLNGGPAQAGNTFNGLPAGNYNVTVTDGNGCSRLVFAVVVNGVGVTATASTINASCATATNGSITVNASNGQTPYQYSLNGGAPQAGNSFTGLAPGNYTVLVSDGAGCSQTLNITVAAGAGVNALATSVATSCAGINNGSITVTASNGQTPYQYSLNGGPQQAGNIFTGLAPGSYTITVTDAAGCSRTITTSVGTGAGIIASATAAATSCAGASNGSITVNASNGQAPYQYSLNGGPQQAGNVFTGLTPGSYTITINDGAGCTQTVTATVNTGAGINAVGTSVAATCAAASNGSITVTASNGQTPYQYSLNGGPAQAGNTFTGLAPGTYNITVNDAAGCTRTISVNVGAASGITGTASVTGTSCAAASNGSITATPTSGQSPWQYSLNGGPVQASNIFNGLAAGSYTVTITDAAGCSVNVAATITAGTGFTATSATTPATCATAANGTITVTPSGGAAPYSYSLNGGTAQASATFTGVLPGSHSIAITDGAGCVHIIAVTVPAGSGITATAAATPTSCNGAVNGSVTLTPTSGQSPWQYQMGAGPFQAPAVFGNLAPGNYTFTVRDFYGCTASVNATVNPGPNLAGTAAVTNVSCNAGNDGRVTINPTNGNAPYQYSLNGGPVQGSNTFNNLTPGNYTVQFTDGSGCSGQVSFTIGQPPLLTISASASPVLCNGQSNGVITVNGTGGTGAYQYSLTGIGYQAANTFNVAAGNYTVYIRDANNCVQTTTLTVTGPAALQVSGLTTNGTCNGGNDGGITASATGGTGAYQYSIDGNIFQAGTTFSVLPGNYTITVKDGNNCTATAAVVVGLTNNLSVTTRPDTAICEGRSAVLQTTGNGASFAWSPAAGLNDATLQNPVATPSVTTQYIVTATLGVCTKNDTVLVQVNTAPVADAGPGTIICYGQTYQLQGSGGTVYTWRPASLLSNANIAAPVATPRNTTVFYLKVRDAIGCESLTEDTVKVIVTPPIAASAGRDSTVLYGEPFQLNATGGSIYNWSPATGLSDATIANPVATLFADQVYHVDVSTPAGCKGSATIKLKVFKGPEIYVPTGFSPNGDGLNDFFRVVPVGIKVFDFLKIYNRWGQLIFETKLPDVGWGGRFQSQDQPAGTYVYVVQGKTDKGKTVLKKGTFILVR